MYNYNYVYSKTSDSGPSELGTQYNKPLNKGRFSRSQIIGLPIVLIHFEPPRRGQPLYKGQNTLIYIGTKVSFVRRFDCINNVPSILTTCYYTVPTHTFTTLVTSLGPFWSSLAFSKSVDTTLILLLACTNSFSNCNLFLLR